MLLRESDEAFIYPKETFSYDQPLGFIIPCYNKYNFTFHAVINILFIVLSLPLDYEITENVSSICVFFKLKQYIENRIVIQQTSIEYLIYLNKFNSHTDVVGDYLVSMYAN